MLEARGIFSGYGEVTVLKDLHFDVGDEILAVLGANGAGKSTLMWTITRVLPLRGGKLFFKGEDVSGTPANVLASKGLALVPQEGNVFPHLTVEENLSIGGLVGRRDHGERLDDVFALFPALKDRLRQSAGTLSGGEGQMVAVGRALMQDPELLLLDEPTAGLAPIYVDAFFETIAEIHRTRGISIILAEQNATKAREVADRVMLLQLGEVSVLGGGDTALDVEELKRGYGL
jgi:branched-chain amino acid transport system ATP-binding protein